MRYLDSCARAQREALVEHERLEKLKEWNLLLETYKPLAWALGLLPLPEFLKKGK